MGWGALRVWNDDEIAANSGFPPHPHSDMEIITYVREGAITHKDSLGNEGRTEAGDVQVMSAGTGIRHAEYNLEPETTTLFQIWIEPRRPRRRAVLGRPAVPEVGPRRQVRDPGLGLPDDGDALPIRTPARVAGATIKAGETTEYEVDPDRHVYLVSAVGSVEVNGVRLDPRDGAAITARPR